jgi:hypothetical protein
MADFNASVEFYLSIAETVDKIIKIVLLAITNPIPLD